MDSFYPPPHTSSHKISLLGVALWVFCNLTLCCQVRADFCRFLSSTLYNNKSIADRVSQPVHM